LIDAVLELPLGLILNFFSSFIAFSIAVGSGADVRVKYLQGVWSFAWGTRVTEGTGIVAERGGGLLWGRLEMRERISALLEALVRRSLVWWCIDLVNG
jgi:hypothetical protein